MYKFGEKSKEQLITARVDLRRVVRRALTITDVDFSVIEGVRSQEQQRINIEKGVSWTMNSKHLADREGMSRAVDLCPWVNGKTSHDDNSYRKLARAMFQAASIEGVTLRWGGFWTSYVDSPHWEVVGGEETMKKVLEDLRDKCFGIGGYLAQHNKDRTEIRRLSQ